jgi:hypothetical protein
MRRRLSSSKAAVPTSEDQRYVLKIIGAQAINVSRKQSPFYVCRSDAPDGEPLLPIQTSRHSNSGPTPSWNSQLFEVALPIDTARNCTITFMGAVGRSQLAQGRIPFVALKPGQSATQPGSTRSLLKPSLKIDVKHTDTSFTTLKMIRFLHFGRLVTGTCAAPTRPPCHQLLKGSGTQLGREIVQPFADKLLQFQRCYRGVFVTRLLLLVLVMPWKARYTPDRAAVSTESSLPLLWLLLLVLNDLDADLHYLDSSLLERLL